jgi:hypothetical protein
MVSFPPEVGGPDTPLLTAIVGASGWYLGFFGSSIADPHPSRGKKMKTDERSWPAALCNEGFKK